MRLKTANLKFNVRIIQNPKQKNQITSVWEYDNEKHMNEVRAYLSKNNNSILDQLN